MKPSLAANRPVEPAAPASAPNPQVTVLGPDIFCFENFLSPLWCQQLLSIAQFRTLEPAGIELTQVEADVRNNSLLRLEGDPLLDSSNELLLSQVGQIQAWLQGHYQLTFAHAEACSLLRYQPGEFYKRHIDNILLSSRVEEANLSIPTRDISIIGYLNDDFEGGQTFFDRQSLTVQPCAGSAIVFPANFLYPHQSLPVLSGTKYAWTTWLYY
jgi:prolyl 4-hydroxylase